MAKYIDRDALVEWLKRIPLKDLSDGLGLCRVIMEDDFKKAIKKMPKGIIVDAVPVRHGRWEEWLPGMSVILTGEEMLYMCSNCTAKYEDVEGMRYCPNCGADMRGSNDE